MDEKNKSAAFIERWQSVSGSEGAGYGLFITALCEWPGVAEPDLARDGTRQNAHAFERRVTFAHGDGNDTIGFVDYYERGAFVPEAKKVKPEAHTMGFDEGLLKARSQSEGDASALHAAEGRQPLVIVVGVGRVAEQSGGLPRSGWAFALGGNKLQKTEASLRLAT